jgi:hypothetical protein
MTFLGAAGRRGHRGISVLNSMEPNTPDTPQELLALNSERVKPKASVKLMEAQNTIVGLKLGPIDEMDLLLDLVRRQADWHHFVMKELLDDSAPEGEAVAVWSADLQRLEQSLSLLTNVRFGE